MATIGAPTDLGPSVCHLCLVSFILYYFTNTSTYSSRDESGFRAEHLIIIVKSYILYSSKAATICTQQGRVPGPQFNVARVSAVGTGCASQSQKSKCESESESESESEIGNQSPPNRVK